MIRGMQARALFRRKRAKAIVQRQMLYFVARAFVSSARVANRIREEMRKKNVRRAGKSCPYRSLSISRGLWKRAVGGYGMGWGGEKIRMLLSGVNRAMTTHPLVETGYCPCY